MLESLLSAGTLNHLKGHNKFTIKMRPRAPSNCTGSLSFLGTFLCLLFQPFPFVIYWNHLCVGVSRFVLVADHFNLYASCARFSILQRFSSPPIDLNMNLAIRLQNNTLCRDKIARMLGYVPPSRYKFRISHG